MKVGLFGGSFDPIHNAHLKLAAAALRQLKLSRVYFVVSPRSPFKLNRRQASPEARLRMVRAAIRGEPRFRAADWELRRRGPSYTVSTLRAYRRAHPEDEIFLIAGTDALAGLPRWKDPAGIARLARLAAGRRPGAAWPRLPAGLAERVVRLKGTFPDVSSTAIRAGRFRDVPPAARAILLREGLYR